jgi:hypothetical protein
MAGADIPTYLRQRRRHVQTRRSETDPRQVVVRLTEAGQATYEEILPHMQARQERLLSALDPAERKAIFGIIGNCRKRPRRLFRADDGLPERDIAALRPTVPAAPRDRFLGDRKAAHIL